MSHALKHIHSFLIYQYLIYLFLYFCCCCFLLLGKIFNLHLKHSQTSKKIMYLRKHTVLMPNTQPYAAPKFDTNRKGRCFIFHIWVQEDFWIGIGSINQVLKAPPLSYHALPCRDWWNGWCNFTKVGYQYLEGIMSISGSVRSMVLHYGLIDQ